MRKPGNGNDRKNLDDPVAKKLRSLRAELRWTQADVAKRLKITQQAYSNYENGSTKLDSNMIVKVCETYGISSDTLLGLDGNKSGSAASSANKMVYTEEDDHEEIISLLRDFLKNQRK